MFAHKSDLSKMCPLCLLECSFCVFYVYHQDNAQKKKRGKKKTQHPPLGLQCNSDMPLPQLVIIGFTELTNTHISKSNLILL